MNTWFDIFLDVVKSLGKLLYHIICLIGAGILFILLYLFIFVCALSILSLTLIISIFTEVPIFNEQLKIIGYEGLHWLNFNKW